MRAIFPASSLATSDSPTDSGFAVSGDSGELEGRSTDEAATGTSAPGRAGSSTARSRWRPDDTSLVALSDRGSLAARPAPYRRSLSAFATTVTLEPAIAADATSGDTFPTTASGIISVL